MLCEASVIASSWWFKQLALLRFLVLLRFSVPVFALIWSRPFAAGRAEIVSPSCNMSSDSGIFGRKPCCLVCPVAVAATGCGLLGDRCLPSPNIPVALGLDLVVGVPCMVSAAQSYLPLWPAAWPKVMKGTWKRFLVISLPPTMFLVPGWPCLLRLKSHCMRRGSSGWYCWCMASWPCAFACFLLEEGVVRTFRARLSEDADARSAGLKQESSLFCCFVHVSRLRQMSLKVFVVVVFLLGGVLRGLARWKTLGGKPHLFVWQSLQRLRARALHRNKRAPTVSVRNNLEPPMAHNNNIRTA